MMPRYLMEKSVKNLTESEVLVIVKEFFKYEQLSCVCPKEVPVCICEKEPQLKIITKKPILPSDAEVELNRRARSAKLRIAERI